MEGHYILPRVLSFDCRSRCHHTELDQTLITMLKSEPDLKMVVQKRVAQNCLLAML